MSRSSIRLAALSLIVALIGAVDYATGPDIGFSLFYLVPILWSAWNVDRKAAIAIALLAAAFWTAADSAWNGVTPVGLWNAFTRLGIYVGMAWLLAQVRVDQERLLELNGRLERLLAEEQQLARTDALTGLPNRRMFVDELRRAAARSHRSGRPLAVAYLDLEHLDALNSRLGHAAGDAVLRRIADLLKKHVRGNDVAARLGGDEFAILLDDCPLPSARVTTARLLEQLRAALAEVTAVSLGVSVGVACFDAPPSAPGELLDHADAAMYCAKRAGSGEVYVVHLPGPARV